MPENNLKGKKILVGTVISNKMQKTIVVQVQSMKPHKQYTRLVHRAVKFKVHDENNSAKVGEKVRIIQTRPLSKDKRWRLIEVIK